ncbi:transport and Golgi organization protein 6 homolog [Mucor ambiguus]|uniref:Transport and Golgi organization protein 6 homolog n=1 Tax=Mucor ambiguus TaxID=91626 RepID=A0A0C9N999_9FUNG|nr:transport and Golgi organization protein 6 homolog [Mucor ambiguus]
MSNHEQDKATLKDCLIKAHQLVGEKVDIREEGSIEETLVQRLEKLEIDVDDKDPRKAFVYECLKVLLEIQTALLAVCASGVDESDKDYLGVRDFRLIHTLLQVIISWGFYPCFLPGVGVPLSKRVKSGYTNHELLSKDEKDQQNQQPHTVSTETIYSLFHLVTPLVDVIAHSEKVPSSKSYTTVASILMSRHLPDLYAALLELAYAPASAFQQQAASNDPSALQTSDLPMTPGSMIQQVKKQAGLKREERDKCARMFMWLFDRSDLPRAMESLMALLGNSPLHPVPNWLRTICGRFLSRILLKPNGVAIVLEFTIGHVDQLQLAQLESIAKLILSVPQQMASIESYYAIITPQLLELLEKEPLTSPTCQAVTFIIGRIIGKHADLAKIYIVDKIVGPLLTAWNTTDYAIVDSSTNMDRVSLPEDALTLLLHTLHRVMIGGEPSPDVIQTFLSSSIAPLYHLYEFTVHSKSGLRETVLDLLSTYFRITTTSDAIRELKRILLDKTDLSGARVAYFAPGPTGGVVLRLRSAPKLLAGNELPIHAGILVEFLQMSDNADLCGDFFVFLLNEYSSLQTRKQDPKVILLTLHLIMGMLDTLGPTILGKPTQIISFANNIVQDHVERLFKKSKQPEKPRSSTVDFTNIVSQQELEDIEDAAHDEQFSVEDDFESLVLAINLIRAVLHENDELSDQAIQLLKASVDPLKQLEKYPFELVQESVNEVLLAITSYLSAQKMSGMKQTSGTSLEASKEKYRDAMKSLQDDLLPIRAHGMGMLKEMALAKDPLVSSGEGLDQLLDIFVRLVQDEDSYIYLNAVKGLSAMTDAYGNQIIKKLGDIYSDDKQKLDNRLRIGEALLQTIQRCGDALGKYVNTLVRPLETVLARRNEDSNLRVSALSLLSMACQTCPVALSSQMSELIDWVLNILEIEKTPEVRRAATVLILSLFRGLASQTLYEYPAESLRRTYRTLRYIEETDPDELTRYQARVALSDLDAIMRNEIFKNQQHSVNYK